MFGRKKNIPLDFDKTGKTAVLRCSICTGEKVAGFKDNSTGRFEEIMLIRNSGDLEEFKKLYGVEEISKEY